MSMHSILHITEQERQVRENAVEQSLASVRLEGLEPGPHVHEIYGRYINGELTLEEMGSEIEALHDREYGPLSLSRNARP
jgi:hypothetical protein